VEAQVLERRLPGSKKACTVPMSAATNARATFIRA
jgi:hypothetical protein